MPHPCPSKCETSSSWELHPGASGWASNPNALPYPWSGISEGVVPRVQLHVLHLWKHDAAHSVFLLRGEQERVTFPRHQGRNLAERPGLGASSVIPAKAATCEQMVPLSGRVAVWHAALPHPSFPGIATRSRQLVWGFRGGTLFLKAQKKRALNWNLQVGQLAYLKGSQWVFCHSVGLKRLLLLF